MATFVGGQRARLADLESRLAAAEAAAAAAKSVFVVTGVPDPGLGKDGDLAADIGDPATSTGLIYLKTGGAWVSTTFQAWTA